METLLVQIIPHLFPIALLLIGGAAGFVLAWVLRTAQRISKTDYVLVERELAQAKAKQDELEKECLRYAHKMEEMNASILAHSRANAVLETEKRAMLEKEAHHGQELKALETRFAAEFENLANRIFDEKAEKFQKKSEDGLGNLLNPLKEKLGEFQKKVEETYQYHANEQHSLKKEIERIVSVNQRMTSETESLSKALRGDVKAQGNWGEVMLERILESSGLRKDIDYVLQGSGLSLRHVEHGTAAKPDAIVKLPDGKHVIVDAKVSLTHYAQFSDAQDDVLRQTLVKQHATSMRSHVQGLTERRYDDLEKLGSPDFVLMFVPNEGAYSIAIQHDAALHDYAWERRIVIVCPSTLFATLKTIASIWRLELQNQNALEIAKQGGVLYDKIAGFVGDMQRMGKNIASLQDSYADGMSKLSQGRGNMLSGAEKLRKMGVKANKQLPTELLDTDDEREDVAMQLGLNSASKKQDVA